MQIKGNRVSDVDFSTRITDAEINFIKKRGQAPKYLLLSVTGHAELMNELSSFDDDDMLTEITSYKGMHVLVSQDMEFPDIELAL